MRKWTLLWRNWPKLSAWAFKSLLIANTIWVTPYSYGQFVQKHEAIQGSGEQALKTFDEITAVAIVDKYALTTTHTIELDGQKYELELDVHSPERTYFLSLPDPAYSFTFFSSDGPLDLYTIHSGTPPNVAVTKNESDCLEVDAVPQSEWRAGLPEPSASPSSHTVTHHIVHHTAGSNSNTNYVQVVRDIYLLHTEINGWSDIGYNFLISQDGTLFEGRDPGENRTEFEVRGAHFCGKNTGTFGVAMLGNYETAEPTSASTETLVNLLTFSLSELEIDPLSAANHRGILLDAISGHRDGCATLCPGENMYRILPDIRMHVRESIEDCSEPLELNFSSAQMTMVGESITFENTSTGYETYSWRFQGGTPMITSAETPIVTYHNSGSFDVTLYGQSGNRTDSLLAVEYVQVEEQNLVPKIYPNPSERGQFLNLAFGESIERLDIYELSGKLVASYGPEESNVFQAPDRAGFYTLVIQTSSQKFTQKLVIR